MKNVLALTVLTIALVACGSAPTPSGTGGTGGTSTGGTSSGGTSSGGTSTGGTSTGNTNPLGTGSLTIQGKLVNYDPSTDTGLYLYEGTDAPVAQSSFDANGNFSLIAPQYPTADFVSAAYVFNAPCGNVPTKNNIQILPSNELFGYTNLITGSSNQERIVHYYMSQNQNSQSQSDFVYLPQDTDITGTIDCQSNASVKPVHIILNLHFKKGWNVITDSADFSQTPVPNIFTSGFSLPNGGFWNAVNYQASATSVKEAVIRHLSLLVPANGY